VEERKLVEFPLTRWSEESEKLWFYRLLSRNDGSCFLLHSVMKKEERALTKDEQIVFLFLLVRKRGKI
jgi:hypothetical protein